jgi:hypothetical protein
MEIKEFTCEVSWNILNIDIQDDLIDKMLFERSILGHVNSFKSLPPIGLYINNGRCDAAKIEDVYFNGITNHIYIYLDFDS